MRVKVGRKYGILNIAQFPVKSLKVVDPNYIILGIEFGIDVTACLNENIQIATVDAYGKSIPIELPTLVLDSFRDGLRAATITDANEKTRITDLRNTQKVASTLLDITKFISNDSIGNIREGAFKKINVIKTYESDVSLLDSTSFELDVPNEQKYEDVESFCFENIRIGKDPALIKGSFPIVDPVNYDKRNIKNFKNNAQTESYKIIGNSKKYVRGKFETRFTTSYFEIKIPRLSIFNLPSLYFEVSLINNLGTVVSIEKFSFSNQQIESDIKSIEKIQDSNNATQYSRVINRKLDAVQNPYVAKNFTLLKNQIEYKNIGTRIVREIKNRKHINSKISFNRPKLQSFSNTSGQNVIPFSIAKIEEGIKVVIQNIGKNIVSLGIEKRNATLNSKFQKLKGDGLDLAIVEEGSTIEFYDLDLKHDSIYEYRIFYVDSKGNIRHSSNIVTYHYASTSVLEPASLSLTNASREIIDDINGSFPVISFDLDASLTTSGIEVVREFLIENNIDEAVLGTSGLESGSYKKLLLYQVDRQNMRTGDIETFGTMSSSTFIDDSASPKSLRTIKPLNILDSYKYTVRLGLRNPEAVAPIQTTSKDMASIGKKSYNFRSYKFLISSRKGLIPSSLRLQSSLSRSLGENFMEFSLGVESSISINAESYFPSIVGLNVRKTLVNFNLLEWSTNGDIELIDHFRVYAIADGVEAYIGAAHPHVTDGSYYYEDYEMFDRIGEVIYRVVPVLLNYEEASGDSRVSIITESNLPTFLR